METVNRRTPMSGEYASRQRQATSSPRAAAPAPNGNRNFYTRQPQQCCLVNKVWPWILSTNPKIIIGLIMLLYCSLLVIAYWNFPTMTPDERYHVKNEAKILGKIISGYTQNHKIAVLFCFSLLYIFLQTFAIPGSIFLSILSGFLFPFWTGILAVCFCAAGGASCCYMLSWLIGRKLVEAHCAPEIREFAAKVNEYRDNLLYYLIFLRVVPIPPNWLINILSPFVGIPLSTFWIGTFVGAAPSVLTVLAAKYFWNMMSSSNDYILPPDIKIGDFPVI